MLRSIEHLAPFTRPDAHEVCGQGQNAADTIDLHVQMRVKTETAQTYRACYRVRVTLSSRVIFPFTTQEAFFKV